MKQLIHYYNKYCIGQFVEMNRCVDEYFYPKTKNGWLYLCVKGAHQYCIKIDAINRFITNLIGININQLQSQKYCDFEDLYAHIARCQVKGIGDLTLYDTALRIGHVMHPCIYPKQYVYLARGAKNSFICPNAYDQNITAIDCISDDCDNGDTHFDL